MSGTPNGIAPFQALGGQPLEARLRVLALPDLARVLVAELVEAEAAVRGDLARAVHRRLVAGEEPQHVGLGAQAALGVGKGGAADGVDAEALADAGQDVDQPAAGAVVHDRLGGGDERQAEIISEAPAAGQMRRVLAIVARSGDEVGVRVATGERAGLRQPGLEAAAGGGCSNRCRSSRSVEVVGVKQAGRPWLRGGRHR